MDLLEDAIQCTAELHGLWRGRPVSIIIHIKVGVVGNGPGPSVSLWDHPQGADSEVGVVHQQFCREEGPVAFVDHISVLFSEELEVFFC